MKTVYLILGWFFVIVIFLFALSLILNGNWLRAVPLLIIILLILPPVTKLAHILTGSSLSLWVRDVSIVVILGLFVLIHLISKPQSIYKTPEVEAQFMAMYDSKME